MTDSGRHAPDLAVFAFDEFEAQPASWNGFAKTNWRDTRRNFRLGVEQPRAAGKRFESGGTFALTPALPLSPGEKTDPSPRPSPLGKGRGRGFGNLSAN